MWTTFIMFVWLKVEIELKYIIINLKAARLFIADQSLH